jgi:hypothetical protein
MIVKNILIVPTICLNSGAVELYGGLAVFINVNR